MSGIYGVTTPLPVIESTLLAGEDVTNNRMMVEQRNTFQNITTATTTTVKTGAGFLHTLTVNTTAAGTIIIKDGAAIIATLKASVAEQTFEYDVAFATSLVIVTAAASDVTVSYR